VKSAWVRFTQKYTDNEDTGIAELKEAVKAAKLAKVAIARGPRSPAVSPTPLSARSPPAPDRVGTASKARPPPKAASGPLKFYRINAFGGPKGPGDKPDVEGHGFSRARRYPPPHSLCCTAYI